MRHGWGQDISRRELALCAATIGLGIGSLPAWVQAQTSGAIGAKDLFFGDDRSALVSEKGFRSAPPPEPTGQPQQTSRRASEPAKTNPGLRVWLTDPNDASNGSRKLSPQQVFRTGDRFKLWLQSNRDGYLYLVNVGTSGQTRLLFPRGNQDNRIQRRTDFSLSSALVFSEPAGTEQLVAVLSPTPIDDAPVQLGDGSTRKVSVRGGSSLGQASSGQPQRPAGPENGQSGQGRDGASASLDLALADLRGSKDLKFDDDGAELIAVSNRSDERPGGFAPVVVNLRLTHRR